MYFYVKIDVPFSLYQFLISLIFYWDLPAEQVMQNLYNQKDVLRYYINKTLCSKS